MNTLKEFTIKALLYLGLIIIGLPYAYANTNIDITSPDVDMNAFIAMQGNKVISENGYTDVRTVPGCSFNIAIAAMACNEGIIKDENTPEIKPEDASFICKDGLREKIDLVGTVRNDGDEIAINPTSWLEKSATWYSVYLLSNIGMNKINNYLKLFNYGNQDLSMGSHGKNIEGKPVISGWGASGSLEISPKEQVKFVQKLVNNKLGISLEAHQLTRKILVTHKLNNGWTLHFKTGLGGIGKRGDQNFRWFGNCAGYAEKEGQEAIVFCNRISKFGAEFDMTQDPPSPHRMVAIRKMIGITNKL